jgi:N-acetylglucosamine kinase-like BadF-type ATPase
MQPLGTTAAGVRSHDGHAPHPELTCLVVDAGRTGCRAALYGGGETAVATGPGLPGVADAEGSAEPLVSVVKALLDSLPRLRGELDAICVGMTGILRPGPVAAAVAEALGALIPARRVLVTSDVVTSYCGAVGLDQGVAVAAGTGSITLAVGALGVARVDGWGYLLGDAGSGYEVGRRGLESALRAHDGRDGSARLAELAGEAFGSLDDVVPAVYGATNPVSAVASFAEQVAAAARGGDRVARAIWADAAAALAESALAAVARACAPGAPVTLSWTGSLFEARDLLLEPFLARVGAAAAAAGVALTPKPPLGTALDGGYLLTAAPDDHPILELVQVEGVRIGRPAGSR